MCGIHASISTRGFKTPSDNLKHLLSNRGPDHVGSVQARIDSQDGQNYWVSLMSTVLALRGGHITAQPFLDTPSGSALCWNGEAWKIDSDLVVGNDGQVVFELLLRASSAQESATESAIAVIKALKNISGPFAFVFLDKIHARIYFGRDRLGRRSLLRNDSNSDSLELSSIADSTSDGWQEVEADAIYQLSYGAVSSPTNTNDSPDDGLLPTPSAPIKRYPWGNADKEACADNVSNAISLGIFNRAHPGEDFILNDQTRSVEDLRHHLNESLKLRVLNIPLPPGPGNGLVRVAVLFSGGLDCTVLARMAHDLLPPEQHIDLINVAFENPRVVQAAKRAAKSKVRKDEAAESKENVKHLESGLEESSNELTSPFENCPDRETGRKTFQELRDGCPSRVWRFVAVNIPYAETVTHRSQVVNLIHPHHTEMDLSIAYALYFASRGTGLASTSLDPIPATYTSPARVLLSGLGADELFGGYTRHTTAFNRRGFTGLIDELKLDVDRLGKRNLGRDDRVISHWGREARFPYLDETFVKWAVECPIWEKCGFRLNALEVPEVPDLEPGKKVLRLLAYALGMLSVAQEKKRAIQFGARTAKMEIGKTKGTALIS